MSTPELLRAEETHLIGRIRHAPRVNDECNEANQVAAHRHGMEARKLFGSRGTLILRGTAILDLMHFTDFGREDFLSCQPEAKHENNETKRKSAEGPPGIDHLRKEMRQRNNAADEVDREKAPDEMLRNDAGIVITEDVLHLGAERGGRDAEGKKQRGPQPDGRVKGSDDTKNDEHAR